MTTAPNPLLIGFDLGTSAVKSVLVGTDGRDWGVEEAATPLRREQGRIEFAVEELFEIVLEQLTALARRVPTGARVETFSFATASGNTVLLDAEGRPLTRAISWMDERGKQERLPALDAFDRAAIHDVVGWPYLDIFPLAHLAWWRKHEPALYAGLGRVGWEVTYILHRLTGRWGVDPSTATTFYLQDQVRGVWHQPYLEALGLRADQLPSIAPSGTVLGTLLPEIAARTGLTNDVKVVLGSFDHPAAARSAGVLEPGDMMLSCGTSWAGFYPVTDRAAAVRDRMLVDPFLQPTGPWAALFSAPCIGEHINTWINAITGGGSDAYARFNAFSEQTPPGSRGLTVRLTDAPPARIEPSQCPALSRAVMESAACLMRQRITQQAALGRATRMLTMVGGPSRSRVWTKIVADITGLPVRLSGRQNAGALGAAILAGIGAGRFRDVREGARALTGSPTVVQPDAGLRADYDRYYEAWKATASL